MPVLMLGGARDEVVPRSQMQELWAIISNRGRDAEGNKKHRASGPEKAQAEEEARELDEPGPNDPKAPPRIFRNGVNTYIEFGAGTHSTSSSLSPFVGADHELSRARVRRYVRPAWVLVNRGRVCGELARKGRLVVLTPPRTPAFLCPGIQEFSVESSLPSPFSFPSYRFYASSLVQQPKADVFSLFSGFTSGLSYWLDFVWQYTATYYFIPRLRLFRLVKCRVTERKLYE